MKTRRGNVVDVVCYSLCVWVGLASLLGLPSVESKDYTQKACPGGQDNSPPVEITLTCPSGQVIALGEAIFGRNKYGECTFTAGDCKDKTDAFIICEGRYNCTVHFDRPLSPNCGFATFIIVSYDCQTPVATPPPIVAIPPSSPSDVIKSDDDRNDVISDTGRSDATKGPRKTTEDNTGLIVGCVLAVIVTIIFLVIAIVMVVRRLACGVDPPEDEEKKSSSCHILPCMGMSPNEDRSKSEHAETEPTDSNPEAREEDGGNKRNKKQRGARRADRNQNMSPRLAPVGQEDAEETALQTVPPVSQDRSVATASGVTMETTPRRRSAARSSLVMETSGSAGVSHPVKRHSCGAKVMCAVLDLPPDKVAEGLGHDDLKRHRGGGNTSRGGGSDATQIMERGNERASWGKEGNTVFAKADINRIKGDTKPKTESVAMTSADHIKTHASGKGPRDTTGSTAHKSAAGKSSKKGLKYDAVALPNTETFTSC